MLQNINDRLNTSYETEVPKRTEDILTLIQEKIKNIKWYSSLDGHIDFTEFEIIGDKIEILRTPKIYWPFRSYGRIRFNLVRTEKQGFTKIKCKILPGDNSVLYILAIAALLFVFWTMLLLLLGRRLDWPTKTIILFISFSFPAVFMYLNYRIAKYALTDYSKTVIKLMSA
jgi:hypothetical protein